MNNMIQINCGNVNIKFDRALVPIRNPDPKYHTRINPLRTGGGGSPSTMVYWLFILKIFRQPVPKSP